MEGYIAYKQADIEKTSTLNFCNCSIDNLQSTAVRISSDIKYVTEIKQYKTKSCIECPVRLQCTTNPRGRIIERSQYSKAFEEYGDRIKYDLKKYLLRQQIVEHPFGTIKSLPISIGRGMDHILLKGIKKNT